MKDCRKCGTESPDGAEICAQCGKEFGAHNTRNRPDGSELKGYAAAAFVIGIMGVITSYWYPAAESTYGDVDAGRLALKANLLILGGALTQIGAIAWLMGHVVEAISFLPGKDDR